MAKEKPTFIRFGENRIRTDEIKNYGISEEGVYFQKVYVWNDEPKGGVLASLFIKRENWVFTGKKVKIEKSEIPSFSKPRFAGGRCRLVYAKKGQCYMENPQSASYDGAYVRAEKDGYYTVGNVDAAPGDIIVETKKYLFVTTLENSNHKFFEDNGEFNIFQKIKELDEILG